MFPVGLWLDNGEKEGLWVVAKNGDGKGAVIVEE